MNNSPVCKLCLHMWVEKMATIPDRLNVVSRNQIYSKPTWCNTLHWVLPCGARMGDEQRGEVQRSHMKRAESDESCKVSLRESQNQGERVIEDVCRKTGKRRRKPGALFSFFFLSPVPSFSVASWESACYIRSRIGWRPPPTAGLTVSQRNGSAAISQSNNAQQEDGLFSSQVWLRKKHSTQPQKCLLSARNMLSDGRTRTIMIL